jgi:hypothetical protein
MVCKNFTILLVVDLQNIDVDKMGSGAGAAHA